MYRLCWDCSADWRCRPPPRRFDVLRSAVFSLTPFSPRPACSRTLPSTSTTSEEAAASRQCFRRRRRLCRRSWTRRSRPPPSRGRCSVSGCGGDGGGFGEAATANEDFRPATFVCDVTAPPINSSSSSVSAMSPRYAATQRPPTSVRANSQSLHARVIQCESKNSL